VFRLKQKKESTDNVQHSLVVVPANHRVLLDEVKITRGHGKIMKFGMIFDGPSQTDYSDYYLPQMNQNPLSS
jgi:hypothetical protein